MTSPRRANGVSPPAIVVTFELESRPSVIACWDSDEDGERLTAWLDARPAYAELLYQAVELSGEVA